jgi:hypothetical protein
MSHFLNFSLYINYEKGVGAVEFRLPRAGPQQSDAAPQHRDKVCVLNCIAP